MMTEKEWKNEFLDDGFQVVLWPDSQEYLDIPLDVQDEVGMTLINDEDGLALFGGSAYIIPDDVINHLEKYLPDDIES